MLLLVSASAFAKELPAKIQAAFEKMYPQAVNVEWEQMAGCYVAEFVMDNREIDVWFDENAQWVMTENDVESLEKVPAPVSEAFMESIMSSMRLKDVRIGRWRMTGNYACRLRVRWQRTGFRSFSFTFWRKRASG